MNQSTIDKAETIVKELNKLLSLRLNESGLSNDKSFGNIIVSMLASFVFDNISALNEATEAPAMLIYQCFDNLLTTTLRENLMSELPSPVTELVKAMEEVVKRVQAEIGEQPDAKQTMH